jgi:hypothetical protein
MEALGESELGLFEWRWRAYLSQKQHLLVLRCGHLFEVCEDSSYQHGLAYDATINPYLS